MKASENCPHLLCHPLLPFNSFSFEARKPTQSTGAPLCSICSNSWCASLWGCEWEWEWGGVCSEPCQSLCISPVCSFSSSLFFFLSLSLPRGFSAPPIRPVVLYLCKRHKRDDEVLSNSRFFALSLSTEWRDPLNCSCVDEDFILSEFSPRHGNMMVWFSSAVCFT